MPTHAHTHPPRRTQAHAHTHTRACLGAHTGPHQPSANREPPVRHAPALPRLRSGPPWARALRSLGLRRAFPAPSGDSHSPVRREQHTRGALGADSALWSLVVWPPARGSRSAPRIRAPSAPASAADPGRAAPARRPRGLGRRFICFSVNRADCFAVCLRFPPGNIGGEEPDAPPWAERRGRRGQTWPHPRLPGSCDEDALFLAICNAGLGFKLPLLNESASPWASLLSTGHPVPEAGNPFT